MLLSIFSFFLFVINTLDLDFHLPCMYYFCSNSIDTPLAMLAFYGLVDGSK